METRSSRRSGGNYFTSDKRRDSTSDSEMDRVLQNGHVSGDDHESSCSPRLRVKTAKVGEFAKKVCAAGWKCVIFKALPKWLQDNEYLLDGHRPPLYSRSECVKSIFRVHTETGNIWSHLLGCLAFMAVTVWFLTRPSLEIHFQDKMVFTSFFVGAMACLGLSTAFHTLSCHSESVRKHYHKLDYVGISLLIMGSFIPWLYYGFYCEPLIRTIYLTVTFTLGFACIVASMSDKFAQPLFRPIRAGLFVAFGLSAVIPTVHYSVANGWNYAVSRESGFYLILMAFLYIFGAFIYAARIPEKWFPGKFDIMFQSHQIFHVLVVMAAYANYVGISIEMALHKLTPNECESQVR